MSENAAITSKVDDQPEVAGSTSITTTAITSTHAHIKTTTTLQIELFFQTTSELRERIELIQRCRARIGIIGVNIVNKSHKDPLLDWVRTIRSLLGRDDNQELRICVHYSIKYHKVRANAKNRRGSTLNNVEKLIDFCTQVSLLNGVSSTRIEVLVVSGSCANPDWNSLVALQSMADYYKQENRHQHHGIPLKERLPCVIAVAYNPFFPDETDRVIEYNRLCQKISTGCVSKIYLQFGVDLSLLRTALEKLRVSHPDFPPLVASIFLPTRQLLAQQRFRPWRGVFLSEAFLSGPDNAQRIVVDLLRIYRQYNVELLIEAPGIRQDRDMELLEVLLAKRDAEFARNVMGTVEMGSCLPDGPTILLRRQTCKKRRTTSK